MTPSIIRRFARYHQINRTFGVNIDEDILWLAKWMWDTGDIEERKRRIVQSLTRIEDAETLIAEVGAVTSVSDGPAFLRVRARLDILANELLVQAGIDDPRRWREVKV